MADYPVAELREARVFVHGTLSNPLDAGPLFCRVTGWDDEKVRYDLVYHTTATAASA